MGGWMDYRRMRARNGLPRADSPGDRFGAVGMPGGMLNRATLRGDLDRMEDDYLHGFYPQPPFAGRPAGSSPAERTAAATGVPVEVVRRVLAHVFAAASEESPR